MKNSSIVKATVLGVGMGLSLNSNAQSVDPAQDPHIESHIKAFLNVLNSGDGKLLKDLTLEQARGGLIAAQKSVKVDISGIEVTEKTIHSEGLDVSINIVKPANVKGTLPVFMFFHGGGWVLGDYKTHERLVRDLVVESGAAAVFVNYTPSPEAHYPVAINQAYAATVWVAAHGNEIGVDGKRLAVVGNSVGGNMAAVVALMAKDKKGPQLKLQVLLWPVTNASYETESYKQYGEGRFLTTESMKFFWDSYTTNQSEREQIYASPLLATKEQLQGLPPALVQTAENDVLRDEGEAYARKLDEAGVPTTSTRYNGLIHDWGLLNPLATVPGVRSSIHEAAGQIKAALKN
jgi:acetyl esterase/lipase